MATAEDMLVVGLHARLSNLLPRHRFPARACSFELTQCAGLQWLLHGPMATIEELWKMAYDVYARARASLDPSAKLTPMRAADDYLKQAEELRRKRVVVQAAFPERHRRASEAETVSCRRPASRH